MHRRLCVSVMVVLVAIMGHEGLAYANGRSPGVHIGDVPVRAICEDRTGAEHDLFRARIIGGGTKTLFLIARIGAADYQIPLARIRSLIFSEQTIDQNGFAKAVLLLYDQREQSWLVKVRSEGENLQLSGYTEDGMSVHVALSKCKNIRFFPMGGGQPGSPSGGGAKR